MKLSEIYFARGGKGELYKFPPRKDPPRNNWQDGVLEVDLTNPQWSSYPMELSFLVGMNSDKRFSLNPSQAYEGTIYTELLRKCTPRLIPYTVHLQSVSNFHYHRRLNTAELSCTYEVLNPTEVWRYIATYKADVPPVAKQLVALNDTDLGDLGIYVLNIYDSALAPDVEKGVRWYSDSAFRSGRSIFKPSNSPHYEGREIEMHCAIAYKEESQLRATLGSLARLLLEKPQEALYLNGKSCYYTQMTDCKLTRHRFTFNLHFQLIS